MNEKSSNKKKWYEKFFLAPGEKRWLQIFYNVICEIFTGLIILSIIGVISSIFYFATGFPVIGRNLLGSSIGLALFAFIFYFIGMLLSNLLYNVQITRYNSDRTVELLEEILANMETEDDDTTQVAEE
jgi:ABC-type multidrug transport system permease subunit